MTVKSSTLRSLSFLIDASLSAPWWRDDRARHCAYCGIRMRVRGTQPVPTRTTHDHVIAKSQVDHGVTIPACKACNEAKRDQLLPDFLASDYFRSKRKKKHGKAWSEHELWAVFTVAALRRTAELMADADKMKSGGRKNSRKTAS